mgnify:CR=1 FL=1
MLGDYDALPTGQALVDHWMGQLSGPERKILQPLIDTWPATMSKEALAEVAGYDPTGGGFNNVPPTTTQTLISTPVTFDVTSAQTLQLTVQQSAATGYTAGAVTPALCWYGRM